MDISALKAFLYIAQEGSFSRAAEKLFITQPAISKRIAQLEQTLEAKLLNRGSKRISLTEAGKTLLPHARDVVDRMESIKPLLAAMSEEVGGTLSMACSHHIGLHRMPRILKQYIHQYPEVALDLKFVDSENACGGVETGELELALITLPKNIPARLRMETVWRDPLEVVEARSDRSQPTVTNRTAILPRRNTSTRELVDAYLASSGLRYSNVIETNNLETIRKMVEIGLGWSILPRNMLSESLQTVALEIPPPERRLGLVRQRQRSLSNAARAMIELLKRSEGAEAPSHEQ